MDPERTRRFESLARPNMAAAYNLALWMTRNPADAQDVVQEAFLRALRFFDGYRGGDARAWLLQIVRNAARTWLRAHRSATPGPREPEIGESLAAPAGPWEEPHERSNDPAELIAAMADAQTLREHVAALPADYREVLILREFEGLTYREIAVVLSAPIGTVMSRLSRARDRLAASLKATEGAPS
jgi:RNA polymerase sigma-70 factor (ECF subfamily)